MTFLNPAYLLGLLAAAVPVIIHFLNLRKLQTVDFSTLKFLKEIQKTKIRNLKIKQWLLLLIRMLIIISIVLVFSRPTIKNIGLSGENSLSRTSAVIIVDNSLSLAIKDSKGSGFQEIKDFALKLLSNFHNGDEVAILLSSLENENEFQFSKNLKSLEYKIGQLKISMISNDINRSIEKSIDLLKRSVNANKEIYILSDFQKSKFLRVNLNKEYDDNDFKIFLVPFNKPLNNNIATTDFILDNQIIEPNTNVSFTSQTQNGKNFYANGVISLFVNQSRVAQSSFSLQPDESRKIFFEHLLNHGGLIESMAEVDDDNLTLDNTRYFSAFIPNTINILCISDDVESAKYLELVVKNSGEEIIFNKTSFSQILAHDISAVDLIIIIGGSGRSSEEIRKLIPADKSIMIFPSGKSDTAEFNTILEALNLGKTNLINTKSFIEFEKAEMNHPVLSGLFDDKKITEIESPQIKQYFRIRFPKSFKSIITLQDNYSFLSETNRDRQKIFVFSVSPDLSGSDFPLKGIYAPLILKSINYLALKINTEKKYFPGDIISFPMMQDIQSFKIIKPDGTEDYAQPSAGILSYQNTNQIGCYKFFDGNKLIYFADVNIDPAECKYEFNSPEESANKLVNILKSKIITVKNKNNVNELITEARLGTELWKPLLIIVILLMLSEMVLSRNTKNEISRLNND